MMIMFEEIEHTARGSAKVRRNTNLSPLQHRLLRELANDNRFVIVPSDKNLGPALMDREIYIKRVLQDHLGNDKTYQQLSPQRAQCILQQVKSEVEHLIQEHKEILTTAERTWFERHLRRDHRMPQFYIMPKVHKTPFATRPVESCIDSFSEVASKWLDYRMTQLLHMSRTYIKDSNETREELLELDCLPAHARLFTADAVSMYTNIDINHGLEVFETWFIEFESELPPKFPTTLFLKLLKLVMTCNVFQFGDTYWLQLDGTAMGTSCACMYATMYTALHERKTLLPKYAGHLYFLRRFIDDKIGIWIDTDPDQWQNFKDDMNNFGALTWKVEELSKSVNFLDLTITIGEDRRIVTKTYEKSMNLYLYIPPASAHPPGVLKSIVYGNLRRYWLQNSSRSDFITTAKRFASRLIARGHSADSIRMIFMEAAASLDTIERHGKTPKCNAANASNTLFFHWEYHPNGLSRQSIRKSYNKHCADVSGFDRMIVAFSRPRNIRDSIMRSRLPDVEGSRPSEILNKLYDTGVIQQNLFEV